MANKAMHAEHATRRFLYGGLTRACRVMAAVLLLFWSLFRITRTNILQIKSTDFFLSYFSSLIGKNNVWSLRASQMDTKSWIRSSLIRSSFFLIGWIIIALCTQNWLSERRVLTCQYQNEQPICQLTTKKLLGETQTVSLTNVQRATVEEHIPLGTDMSNSFQLMLITSNDRVWLSSDDSSAYGTKVEQSQQINSFLHGSRRSPLRIDGGWSTIFWIVSGIFLAGEVLILTCIVLMVIWLREPQKLN